VKSRGWLSGKILSLMGDFPRDDVIGAMVCNGRNDVRGEKTIVRDIAAGAVASITTDTSRIDWARLGRVWLPVRSQREPVWMWSRLTALGRFCETVGIRRLTVEL
jgi:hypothetical protein